MPFYKERRSIAMKLGINGLGRIGKLSLWHHVSRKHFSEIVVNVGREVGCGLDDLASMIERDSTYGRLGRVKVRYKQTMSTIQLGIELDTSPPNPDASYYLYSNLSPERKSKLRTWETATKNKLDCRKLNE
jgi:hypothetical protein